MNSINERSQFFKLTMKTSTTLSKKHIYRKPINVMLVGNNPIELNEVYRKLREFRGAKFIPSISFNISDALKKIFISKPNCILVDDNLENKNIQELAENIARDSRTKDIPVTLLKSSNYKEILSGNIQDYLLKESLSSDRLARAIVNVIHYRRTNLYLYKTYKKTKRRVNKFFK